jgi:5-methylcytosine-specific restriction endonuclease McrA
VSGRWAGSHRRDTLPPDWTAIRARIFERDHHACTWSEDGLPRCGAPATDCDHVIPSWRGGSDNDDNLTSLCAVHHALKSSREGNDAQAMARGARKRPKPRDPFTLR